MEQSRTKIFLLDDDSSFLEETKLMLEETGCEVAICARPIESIVAIKEFNPDCLVLDLNMPLFDGEAFIPWIRRQFADLTIVVCTGGIGYDKELFRRFRVNHIIEKPFTQEYFCSIIRAALLERKVSSKAA